MDPARIADLLAPFLGRAENVSPNADLFRSISTYIDILLRWNARLNLTAIRDPDKIVTRHFGESFFAAHHLFPRNSNVETAALGCPAERTSAVPSTVRARGRAAFQSRFVGQAPFPATNREGHGFSRADAEPEKERALAPEVNEPSQSSSHATRGEGASHDLSLADVGAGAGFPGIPIKLWAPEISLTLIESSHKKSTFLREIVRAITLTNINILTARAETISQSFDIVTLRAVERFADVLPAAARLVAPGGRLALLVGAAQVDRARATLPHFSWQPPIPVPESHSRAFLVALCSTPSRTKVEPRSLTSGPI